MRGPSLQKTALLSFALHLTAFLIAFLILRQSSHNMIVASPYTVDLVNPTEAPPAPQAEKGSTEETTRETNEPSAAAESPKKSKKEALKEKKLVESKISELAAKKKKIDTLSRIHEIISIKTNKTKAMKGSTGSKTSTPSAGKGSLSDAYYSKITKEIWDQWDCPPSYCKKDMEAIVSISIMKDGRTVVQKFEKRSGNSLFDRSALKALAKASPLPPPPYEMEIGVRFHP